MENYLIHVYKYDGTLLKTIERHFCIYEGSQVWIFFLPPYKTELIREAEESGDSPIDESPRYGKKYSFATNKHPIFWFFWGEHWFNILVTLLPNEEYTVYLNVATNPIIEEKTLKYIDWELGLKLDSKKELNFLKSEEYLWNIEKLKYSESLQREISKSIREILNLLKGNWLSKLMEKEYIDSLWARVVNLLGKTKEELLVREKNQDYPVELTELEEFN